MIYTHVQGGTGAGTRKAPRTLAKIDWKCPGCAATNKYYWKNCPACFTDRP